MFFNINDVIHLLLHYKYIVIFPFAVLEGPIITIISGFLAHMGKLNFWFAFGVVAAGDLVGDTLYYSLGRFGRERFIRRFGKFFGLNPERVIKLEQHFENHPWKTFTFGKVAHGTGAFVLTAAGLSKVPYFRFLGYNIPTTLANSFLIITIGYYFGQAYESFNTVFDIVGIGVVIVLILLYLYYIMRYKNSPE